MHQLEELSNTVKRWEQNLDKYEKEKSYLKYKIIGIAIGIIFLFCILVNLPKI